MLYSFYTIIIYEDVIWLCVIIW